jgi:hypothetical protein
MQALAALLDTVLPPFLHLHDQIVDLLLEHFYQTMRFP